MKQEKWIEQLRDKLANHEMAAPEGLWEDIEAALPELSQTQVQQPQKARFVALRRWAVAASVAALLATGGFWWFANNPQHPSKASHDDTFIAQKTPNPSSETPTPPSTTGSDLVHEDTPVQKDAHQPMVTALPQEASSSKEAPSEIALTETITSPQKTSVEDDIAKPEETPQYETASHDEQFVIRQLDQQIAQLHTNSNKTPAINLYAMNGFGHQTSNNGVIMSNNLAQNFVHSADYEGLLSRKRETIYLAGYQERQKHHQPISFGLTVSYPLTNRLSLSSGVVFTHLQSDFVNIIRNQQITRKQQLDYIGIPLTAGYRFWAYKGLKTYLSAGVQADWNIHTSLQTEGVDQHLDKDRMQWSAIGALGIQYDIIPQLGVYAEPGIRYYVDNGSRVQNFFKDKPTNFSLQLGLRLNLGQ